MTEPKKPSGLDLLRAPFAARHISKLPKPTRKQTDDVKANFQLGIRCKLCGAWHHKDVVHLDYVGHAALTDRLLDCDPQWDWEPLALNNGLPAFDQTGGLWIKLTVCGVTRLGYGHAASKPNQDPGAREKEVIGDALRNAAMRFGAALDLWHKGDLHGSDDVAEPVPPKQDQRNAGNESDDVEATSIAKKSLKNAEATSQLVAIWNDLPLHIRADVSVIKAKDDCKAALKKRESEPKNADLDGDGIPDFDARGL